MRILVPLDGSVRSEQAIGVAAKLVFALPDAQLVLLRVVELTPMTLMATRYHQEYEVASAAGDEYLRKIAQRDLLRGLTVVRHVAIGVPATTISDVAHALHADLIIMTSHGRTGLAQLALGSVAAAVVRDSAIPTLIVRDADAMFIQETPARILVPLDGTPFAETVLGPASQLAHGWQAEIRLLRVVPTATADSAHDREQIAAAFQYLETIKQRLESEGIATHISVRMGVPQDKILEAAQQEQHPCEVVALATHGRTGFAQMEAGSVAASLVQHLHRPVLIVHPHPVMVPATS